MCVECLYVHVHVNVICIMTDLCDVMTCEQISPTGAHELDISTFGALIRIHADFLLPGPPY